MNNMEVSDLIFANARSGAVDIPRQVSSVRKCIGMTFIAAATTTGLLTTAQTKASGSLGPYPIEPEKFASFAACKDHLKAIYAEDLAGKTDGPIAVDQVTTRETLITTKGVIEISKRKAKYEVRIGYDIRFIDIENGWIQTSYSYEDKTFLCSNRKMTGTKGSGYSLPGFDPIETPK